MNNKNAYKRPIGRAVKHMAEKLVRPAQLALLGPMVMETGPDSPWLYPCAVAEQGAVVRISAFAGMYVGQAITLVWESNSTYTLETSVVEVKRCIDLILPKKVLLDNLVPDGSAVCDVYYEVVSVDGFVQRSAVTRVFVPDRLVSNPPVTVPDAVGGEFDPDNVPAPGLKIEFPRWVDWAARWSSYGRDGRLIATVTFALYEHEEVVYMWRYMLDQTEPGGDVWINYHAANDSGLLVDSLYTVLRVVSMADDVAPVITRVLDSEGEVANGGSTVDTTVTLEGRAAADHQVAILDKAEVLATVTAPGGHWALALSALAFKRYSLKARGLYGSLPESAVRTFSVIYAGEDFETGTLGVMPANTPREFPAMIVTPKDKDASLVVDSIAAPFVTGQAISFADHSSVQVLLKSPVNKITFGAYASASVPGVVPPVLACFDEQGVLILERKLDFGLEFAAWHAVVSPDRKVKTIELVVNPGTSAFVIDNFTFA